MKPALAKAYNDNSKLEEVGRATLQIVHDLKNQLNGLKLYATYLRKRLEREDRTTEERETIAKLIAGLDRAAKDMTALVRYAQPVEMRKQPVDLAKIVSALVADIGTRDSGGLPPITIATEIADQAMTGEFDPVLITQALSEITDDIRTATKSKQPNAFSITLRRQNDEAQISWTGATPLTRQKAGAESMGFGTIHTKLGTRIIEAHGGRVKFENDTVLAWLPLIKESN